MFSILLQIGIVAVIVLLFYQYGSMFISKGPLSKGLFGGRLKKRKQLKRSCRLKFTGRKLKLCLAKAVQSTLHEGSRRHTKITKRIEKKERRIARRADIDECAKYKKHSWKRIRCRDKARFKKRR